MKYWELHSIVVTGGNGFLGKAIVANLKASGYDNIFARGAASTTCAMRRIGVWMTVKAG